jgi:hypothetical protein
MRNDFLAPQPDTDVEGYGSHFRQGAFTLIVRNTDIPAFVAGGFVYYQTPLPGFSDASPQEISDCLRDMEVGISNAGRASLAPDSAAHTVLGEGVVVSSVVRSRGRRR